jgi:hypothetical protein
MKDPLFEAVENAPNAKEVWDVLTKRIENMPMDQVYTIAINLIVQGIRMSVPYRGQAEFIVDDLFGRTKGIVLAHYDSVTGKRKALFPYTQLMQPPFHVNESKFF